MNQEEINVVQTKTLEGVVDRPLNILGAVEVVPHLGADEDVLTLDGGVGLQEVTDTLTNLTLVEIKPGTIQVTVTNVQSSGDSSVGLTLGALAGEGTEADARNLDAVAQCKGLSARHDGCGCEINWVDRRGKEKSGKRREEQLISERSNGGNDDVSRRRWGGGVLWTYRKVNYYGVL